MEDVAMMQPTPELLNELSKQGLTLQPINRDQNAIKDEPKWRIAKLEDA